MGFNVNPVGGKPVIREAHQTQDGGAGNLGYFQGGGEKENHDKDKDSSIFNEKNDTVEFSLSSNSDDKSWTEFLKPLIDFFKKLFKL